MNVEPQIQLRLLELAALDTESAQISHRRRVLPEQQEVTRLEGERNRYSDAAATVEIAIEDLDRDIRKLEDEVDSVRQREERDRAMLQAGTVAAKQLTDLQHELGALERRQSTLEDDLLDVMERREAADADHQHAGAQLSRAEADLTDATRLRDEAVADLDVAENRCRTGRDEIVTIFPTELLDRYERQRERHGIGAALLRARRCGACRIELDRGELARIAKTAPDVVVTCPECGAIMVRTAESGL